MKREIEYWDTEDAERLTYTEQDVAIESILDGTDPLPETIEICGYARVEKPKAEKLAEHVLDSLLESLDEDYGNPEGDCTEPTDEMRTTAEVFVQAVLDDYHIWRCDLVERETIDVAKWVKENRPDWPQ